MNAVAVALEGVRRGCLQELVDEQAQRNPGAVAILAPSLTSLTYGRLSRHIAETVETLCSMGVQRNHRVVLALPDGPEMAGAFIAISAGATCAPLNPAYGVEELDSLLANLLPRALVVLSGSTSQAVAVAEARDILILELTPNGEAAGLFTLKQRLPITGAGHPYPAQTKKLQGPFAGPDDVALALYTSGTTARPKLVPLTHRNICASAENIRTALKLSDTDRCLNVMPLCHVHGLSTIYASLAAGASVICTKGFSASQFLEWMEEFQPTWFTAAPTIHHEILENAMQYRGPTARSSLRFIRSASAPMSPKLMAEIERVFHVPVIEAYGMTEAAPQIASNQLPPGRRKPGSVGMASGPDVAIMDQAGNLMPAEENGEVVIRGANVMLAYENDPEANHSDFLRGWFRTGDRGYLDPEGYLFITGRLKEIINRGGEKISPREVDEVLLGHPAIAQAVTFPIPHETLGEDIAAAIVLKPAIHANTAHCVNVQTPELLIQEIRRFASARLACFKVPQYIVVVNEIPKGPAGKVQRMELAEKLGMAVPGQKWSDFTAPRTLLEDQLSEIWAAVLGVAKPGVHENFFWLGGDSLKAARIFSRLSRDFQVDLTMQSLFERPTVAEMAELVTQHTAERPVDAERTRLLAEQPCISRRTSTGPCPLSFAQQRLWLVDQIDPGNPAYNMQLALRLTGSLGEGALERSLNEILRRHEALRTTFRVVAGQPVQIISPPQLLHLPVVDLTRLPVPRRQSEAVRLAAEDAGRPFHLVHGPLFRATLLRLDAQEHVLLITMHHIVSDGWSVRVLQHELGTIYAAFSLGRPSPLPELPIRYSDFAVWQRKWLQEKIETQLAYWMRQFEQLPPMLELPADRPRPALRSFRGSKHRTRIPARLTEALKTLSWREKATLFMTLLAAFQTLLCRYTGLEDFSVGTPIANRSQIETEGLIGFFANTLVMRAHLAGDPGFRQVLEQVRETALQAYAHQDLPFDQLVEELNPERDDCHNPLFQVMFAFENFQDIRIDPRETPAPPMAEFPDGMGTGVIEPPLDLSGSSMEVNSGTAKFDLTLYLSESQHELTATWQYNTDLFDESRIARMAGNFETLLEGIVANPDATVSELPLLNDAERHQLLVTWNQTEASYSNNRCFHRLFEQQAKLTPDRIAVRCGDDKLTYSDLNQRANQVAQRLQRMGVGPETRVGILLNRSVEMIAAMLSVMKAGGAFVPLDPAYPAARLAFMREDAGLAVVVTEESLLPILDSAFGISAPVSGQMPLNNKISKSHISVLCVESCSEAVEEDFNQNPVSGAEPANLAYVIYTSGSTGEPKGVMITHANLCHYVHAMREALGVQPDDLYLHTAAFAFSSSVRQFAVPLSSGASVAIATPAQIQDPQALFEFIRRQGVSIIDIIPSYWRSCNQWLASLEPTSRAELLRNRLRLILSASEPLFADVPGEWTSSSGHKARLVNMFGQTETTGIVTVHSISVEECQSVAAVPIGRPIANTRAYVLDSARHPVPIGVWGELYIAGPCVARGYLNRPDLTAEKFVPDPFSENPDDRLYCTGDITRYLPDGTIEFSGRADRQLKFRGFRIEPAEIEAVLSRHPGVRECSVVSQKRDATQDNRLVAFVVAKSEVPGHRASDLVSSSLEHTQTQPEGLARELRESLKKTLPEYMIPSLIVELDALPRMPNGKVDRSSLCACVAKSNIQCADALNNAKSSNGEAARPELKTGHQEAVNSPEEVLKAVWAKVLGVDRVGLHDNFFDLGGDSILSIQMITLANQAGLRLIPKQIFQYQTINELARAAVAGDSLSFRTKAEPEVATELHRQRNTLGTTDPQPGIRVTIDSLRSYGQEALVKAGLAAEGAAIVTEVQLEASLRGQPTHDMVSIPRYAGRIASGRINSQPNIRIEQETEISARLDGDNGPGQWVAANAMELAIRKARKSGVGIVGVRSSNHLGAAGHYPWLAAREGLIGLCTTNGPAILAPTGGLTPTFGNNPLGVGIPSKRYHPILLDIAMSVAPRGKIGLQLAEGKPLPQGWILDRFGRPSTDPADLIAGLGIPIGGHKGYGLTLAMEVLAGVLTGSGFGADHRREQMRRREKPPNIGHFFMAIDPELFMPRAEFTARVDCLIEQTKAGERAENVEEILIPGERELRNRETNLRAGVPLLPTTYRALREYAQKARLDSELAVI